MPRITQSKQKVVLKDEGASLQLLINMTDSVTKGRGEVFFWMLQYFICLPVPLQTSQQGRAMQMHREKSKRLGGRPFLPILGILF
jgi:hypothetical protein